MNNSKMSGAWRSNIDQWADDLFDDCRISNPPCGVAVHPCKCLLLTFDVGVLMGDFNNTVNDRHEFYLTLQPCSSNLIHSKKLFSRIERGPLEKFIETLPKYRQLEFSVSWERNRNSWNSKISNDVGNIRVKFCTRNRILISWATTWKHAVGVRI